MEQGGERFQSDNSPPIHTGAIDKRWIKKSIFAFGFLVLVGGAVFAYRVFFIQAGCGRCFQNVQSQKNEITENFPTPLVSVQTVKDDSFSCGDIIHSGNPSSKLNLVFISDDFSDKNEFLSNVRRFVGLNNENDNLAFLNYRPYNELKDKFNVFTFFDPSINWACDSSENLKRNTPCLTEFTAFDILTKYCSWAPEADFLIMLSNKNYRASASHYLPEEFRKLRILRIPVATSGSSKSEVEKRLSQTILLHELGHALGDLSDEYIDFVKEGFKPVAGVNARNIDIEGCPKWCSGSLNTASPYYSKYTNYKSCVANLDVSRPLDSEKFRACFSDDAVTSRNSGDLPLAEADLGVGCYQGSGCFWTAGGTNGFRSMQNSLMRGGTELGSYNENLVREAIEYKIKQKETEVSEIKLKIISINNDDFPRWWLNSNVYNNDLQPFPFKIEFILENQNQEKLFFPTNDRNYVVESSKGVISANLKTDSYEILYAHYPNSKQEIDIRENAFIDISLRIRFKEVNVEETYRFYLKSLTFEKIT